MLQTDQDLISTRNLSIPLSLFQSTWGFLTDRRRCCKPYEEGNPMLEPWIIEQIRRREEEARRRGQRPQLELPVPERPMSPEDRPGSDAGDEEKDEPATKRGVVIIAM